MYTGIESGSRFTHCRVPACGWSLFSDDHAVIDVLARLTSASTTLMQRRAEAPGADYARGPYGESMPGVPMNADPSQFVVWTPPRRSRSVALGRLAVPSGQLAIRDVYDLERAQVVLEVPAGEHCVWATEVRAGGRWHPRFQPAYLSVRLSETAPARVGSPDALHHTAIPPYGVSVYTDLGMVLLHDGDAITPADMESLDTDFEQAWESPRGYYEVHSLAGGAAVFTCKTGVGTTRFPIVTSFDAEDRPVAVHIAVGISDTAGRVN